MERWLHVVDCTENRFRNWQRACEFHFQVREREREREVISFVANQRALALVLCFFICIVGVPLWILHHCWFLERKQFFQQTLGMGIVGKQDATSLQHKNTFKLIGFTIPSQLIISMFGNDLKKSHSSILTKIPFHIYCKLK